MRRRNAPLTGAPRRRPGPRIKEVTPPPPPPPVRPVPRVGEPDPGGRPWGGGGARPMLPRPGSELEGVPRVEGVASGMRETRPGRALPRDARARREALEAVRALLREAIEKSERLERMRAETARLREEVRREAIRRGVPVTGKGVRGGFPAGSPASEGGEQMPTVLDELQEIIDEAAEGGFTLEELADVIDEVADLDLPDEIQERFAAAMEEVLEELADDVEGDDEEDDEEDGECIEVECDHCGAVKAFKAGGVPGQRYPRGARRPRRAGSALLPPGHPPAPPYTLGEYWDRLRKEYWDNYPGRIGSPRPPAPGARRDDYRPRARF